ncbi:hypothetical protein MUY14_12170 [Amycolatopsis sp. FBCC-B4732]|uniref:hypothetical protein n=1 Tax=Amycolatopsis sp. FBCC-B4732 TaxID=3079339 RepID=UPI001FF19937|nr:hypothetical protein [Amycolatopsis sp. FBCC-B4732]UOX91335.1 hypothetical protein MUY14_12170 [Amycolatopsis sp. FBCC-B4732]
MEQLPQLFGEPHEAQDGTTVIPVSRPVGVFTIREGEVKGEPAVDATRVALPAVTTGLVAATLGTLAVLRRPPWPDVSLRRQAPPAAAPLASAWTRPNGPL